MSNRASPRGDPKLGPDAWCDICILAVVTCLLPEFADVVSQSVFDIARPVEPSSINLSILFCAAGRAIEARHTSHSGAISKSGGKLATSTKRLVSLIACFVE